MPEAIYVWTVGMSFRLVDHRGGIIFSRGSSAEVATVTLPKGKVASIALGVARSLWATLRCECESYMAWILGCCVALSCPSSFRGEPGRSSRLSTGSSVLAVMGEPPAYGLAPVGCSVQDPVTACGDTVTWPEP